MVRLEDAFAEFMLSCKTDRLSEKTLIWYQSLLGKFLKRFPGATFKDVETHDLRVYLNWLEKSGDYKEATLSAHNRALHKFFAWCSLEYDVPNPMRRIRYPEKIEPKPREASIEDVLAMYDVAGVGNMGIRNRAILAFLLDTGCRAAGLCGLRLSDLSLDSNRGVVTEKGKKTRAVIFTFQTSELLRKWLEVSKSDTYVFYDFDTFAPLKPNGLYQLTRRLAKKANVKGRFNPHSFRHLFSKHYVMNGGDVASLSKILGHRDVSTTVTHYVVFTDKELHEKHELYSPAKMLVEARS